MYQSFHYELNFDELELNTQDIISYMGYADGNLPDGYQDILSQLIDESKTIITPECGYVLLPQNSCSAANGVVSLDGIDFKTEKIIAGPLKKMNTAAVFLGTVGPQFDKWSKEVFQDGDPLAGYIIDILGSEIAESIADWLETKIVTHADELGMKCSNRYSPGYCGWSVAEQHKLFGLFPKNFCGVSLTTSALMKPHKSVSGIIGLGNDIKWKDFPCDVCNLTHCHRNRNKEIAK